MSISLPDRRTDGFEERSDVRESENREGEDTPPGGSIGETGIGTNEERRAVEALAQALYEAEDPAGIAWSKRRQIVRDPWIARSTAGEEKKRPRMIWPSAMVGDQKIRDQEHAVD